MLTSMLMSDVDGVQHSLEGDENAACHSSAKGPECYTQGECNQAPCMQCHINVPMMDGATQMANCDS